MKANGLSSGSLHALLMWVGDQRLIEIERHVPTSLVIVYAVRALDIGPMLLPVTGPSVPSAAVWRLPQCDPPWRAAH